MSFHNYSAYDLVHAITGEETDDDWWTYDGSDCLSLHLIEGGYKDYLSPEYQKIAQQERDSLVNDSETEHDKRESNPPPAPKPPVVREKFICEECGNTVVKGTEKVHVQSKKHRNGLFERRTAETKEAAHKREWELGKHRRAVYKEVWEKGLMNHVWKHLSERDLLKNRLVCKKWCDYLSNQDNATEIFHHRVCMDNYVHSTIQFSLFRLAQQMIVFSESCHKQLEERIARGDFATLKLLIQHTGGKDANWSETFSHPNTPSSIEITINSSCNVAPSAGKNIHQMVQSIVDNPSVKSLYLNLQGQGHTPRVPEIVSGAQYLKQVTLSANVFSDKNLHWRFENNSVDELTVFKGPRERYAGSCFENICKGLQWNTSLRSLILSGIGTVNTSMPELRTLAENNTRLTHLDLNNNGLIGAKISSIIPASVETLNLSFNSLANVRNNDVFGNCHNLRHLIIQECHLNPSLIFPDTLETLDVSGNEIHFVDFTKRLSELPALRHLRMRKINIQGEPDALFQYIASCGLQTLEIFDSSTGWLNSYLEPFCEALQHNSTLVSVDYKQNNQPLSSLMIDRIQAVLDRNVSFSGRRIKGRR